MHSNAIRFCAAVNRFDKSAATSMGNIVTAPLPSQVSEDDDRDDDDDGDDDDDDDEEEEDDAEESSRSSTVSIMTSIRSSMSWRDRMASGSVAAGKTGRLLLAAVIAAAVDDAGTDADDIDDADDDTAEDEDDGNAGAAGTGF
jgi:hypothetical protein